MYSTWYLSLGSIDANFLMAVVLPQPTSAVTTVKSRFAAANSSLPRASSSIGDIYSPSTAILLMKGVFFISKNASYIVHTLLHLRNTTATSFGAAGYVGLFSPSRSLDRSGFKTVICSGRAALMPQCSPITCSAAIKVQNPMMYLYLIGP